MYEKYSKQALPSKNYRELLGTAIYVFNSNNSFIIENVLRCDEAGDFDWYMLTDWQAGKVKERAKHIIEEKLGKEIFLLFDDIIEKRNRIVHSFPVTNQGGEQVLRTKNRAQSEKGNRQFEISEDFLLGFIRMNDTLSNMLHGVRGY
ncbi:selenium binding protein [Flavonifractor sp. AGMB03687]|uniref:selenium binding protein n=1 Tax=Flavonifractor sp. AGMB03687 TaxID=2785133 RepID=UPI001AE0BD63|nr:selenium binding protein [Flavonifractor sp. AGMB03687]